ncbi:hypothetical protein G6F22_021524 [Rhizopus arrhizus]|nr:hypothetical protein G6F22_021524 [Rhizopus arrhizus]KAG1244876.1 hypothetical protein G6F65_021565 [Rhizopus arrhizus]
MPALRRELPAGNSAARPLPARVRPWSRTLAGTQCRRPLAVRAGPHTPTGSRVPGRWPARLRARTRCRPACGPAPGRDRRRVRCRGLQARCCHARCTR